MSGPTTHRFLANVRRGLASHLGPVDDGGPLPARASTAVGLTVTGLASQAGVDVTAYGPGDVVGLDTRLIVRTDPERSSSNVEPNFCPTIEFDPPDLPWMMTPAQPNPTNGRLRPWLALICVDRRLVAPPRVEAGRPLPVLTVPVAAVATELPDLSESWAWAHVQVTKARSAAAVTSGELRSAPELNVSRLICPRRLVADRQWVACLVPTFDVGVFRGLTGEQPTAATMGPAWTQGATVDVQLPVYFHWEFSTGPLGSFEELARQLVPFEVPDTVGFAKMYVGGAGGGGSPTGALPEIDATEPRAHVMMDGALRAPSGSPGRLSEVDEEIRDALRNRLDGPANAVAAGDGAQTPEIGPPIYGQWHARQHLVPTSQPRWLRQLNLDPRGRVAASLGTEIVKARQEEFMDSAWEQVGDVLRANELLSRARLAMAALKAIHQRHMASLPADRLLQVMAPLQGRVKMAQLTITATVAKTSLPNRAADAALRRLTSAQRPMMKVAARRANAALPGSQSVRSHLFATLADGRQDVEPNRFVPDGLNAAEVVDAVDLDASAAPIDLSGFGLAIDVPLQELQQIKGDREAAAGADIQLSLRPNLRATGLVTETHVREILATPGEARGVTTVTALPVLLRRIVESAARNPGSVGFLIDATAVDDVSVSALDAHPDGRLVARAGLNLPARPVANLSGGRPAAGSMELARTLTNLRPGSISGAVDGAQPTIDISNVGQPVLADQPPAVAQPRVSTNTLPALVSDAETVARFERAFRDTAGRSTGATAPELVAFPIAAAQATLLAATDPTVVVARRTATMLTVDGGSFLDSNTGRFTFSETRDRVLAAPELPAPAYRYLAQYDQERFLPGLGVIPPDSISLLETNPRFIEGLMVGLNHEMNRELLWRGYPTDQRGTPFRYFWGWLDGGADIPPIHQWVGARSLGNNARGGGGGQLVLLLRGSLLRRYPRTLVYAWKGQNGELKDPPEDGDISRPVFAGRFDPDVSFVGFNLTDADIIAEEWFFVLQEPPTEPRFGFDEPSESGPPSLLGSWSDATWDHAAITPGGHLQLAGSPLEGTVRDGAEFVVNSAHLAAITLQKPVRVAVPDSHIFQE